MTETLTVTYMNCGFCTARNHCAACGEELARDLAGRPGIEAARVNLPDRSLEITHSLDRDGLEDLLDGMGLLVG